MGEMEKRGRMVGFITKAQLEELSEAEFFDRDEYHKLLEDYTGIVAKPYTGYSYYDAAGNYIGDSGCNDVLDLLKCAYIKVVDNG